MGQGKTVLDPGGEQRYQAWLKAEEARRGHPMDSDDYDMRGFWLENGGSLVDETKPAPFVMPGVDASAHFNDAHKLPNHPTFSDEAIRSAQQGGKGPAGGHWDNDGDNDYFVPSPQMMGGDPEKFKQLMAYFKEVEPGVKLVKPPMDERGPFRRGK